VRRAASAASTGSRFRSDGDVRSRRRFLTVVGVVVAAGIAMVSFAWSERQYNHPTVLDSWQNAYAVFDCVAEQWLEPFPSTPDASGIRTRGDGIIYIEPATDAVAGRNATLEVFLNGVGATLTDESLTLPDGTVLAEDGQYCRTEEARLQVMRYDADTETASEFRFDDLAGTRFEADRQTLVIALAPIGAKLPLPPSAADLPEAPAIVDPALPAD
jgi:hypothetical protein